MLSRQGTIVLSGAVLVTALSATGYAAEGERRGGPAHTFCQELRDEMVYYYQLFEKGGTAKQMAVWKKQYGRRINAYGRSSCPKLDRKMLTPRTAAKPETTSGQAAS